MSYIYVRQERSSSETIGSAPRILKKNPTFMRKKRIKEKKEKKSERPFALTESYFLLHSVAIKNLKRNSFLYVAFGAVPGEYITCPLVPGK